MIHRDMSLRTCFVISLILWCVFSYNTVDGSISSTEEDDLESEKQLKLLNKPAVKSIKTTHGDVYDCVDFYKQPAFDHPLLKNHTFHPQTYSEGRNFGDSMSTAQKPNISIWLNGEGCPAGTIPLRKITKDDLIRIKKTETLKSNPQDDIKLLSLLAVIHTPPNTRYYGAGMTTTIYNPKVYDSQSSSSRMKLQTELGSTTFLEMGWTVFPALYKDNLTRLYIRTSIGPTRCYNTYCPGFVLQSSKIPIDGVYSTTSTRGGQIYVDGYRIFKDKSRGNWVLQMRDEVIGHWPKAIMEGHFDYAGFVEWGGEILYPPHDPSIPPEMGAGFLSPLKDMRVDAYTEQVVVVNENNQLVNAQETIPFSSNDKYYRVNDVGIVEGKLQHMFFFGGPHQY